MTTALSVAPLYSLGQDDQNEMQYDIFGHVMLLVPAFASHTTDGIMNYNGM